MKTKHLKYVVMGEMSMIRTRMLHQIESRCSDTFSESKENFGGLFVYMFGDFRELPPVKVTALYSDQFFEETSSKGELIFDSFERVIKLSVSFR